MEFGPGPVFRYQRGQPRNAGSGINGSHLKSHHSGLAVFRSLCPLTAVPSIVKGTLLRALGKSPSGFYLLAPCHPHSCPLALQARLPHGHCQQKFSESINGKVSLLCLSHPWVAMETQSLDLKGPEAQRMLTPKAAPLPDIKLRWRLSPRKTPGF